MKAIELLGVIFITIATNLIICSVFIWAILNIPINELNNYLIGSVLAAILLLIFGFIYLAELIEWDYDQK